MDYIDFLTKEEKSVLCEMITGREFKGFFKSNERKFSKLRKGFRAKSLTEQQALSIAKAYIENPFIALWVNAKVDFWLAEIQENIAALEEEGFTHDIALATTMLDSFFVNNVDIYLKLAGVALDPDALSSLYYNMGCIKMQREKNAEITEQGKITEEERKGLLAQIRAAQQSINNMRAEYEMKIQDIEQEREKLEFSLAEAQERIAELESSATSEESRDAAHLAQYDDTDASILPSIGSDEIISLCGVTSDYNGQKWLIRYADLAPDGQYHVFRRNEDLPPYFSNRDKIFYKDGPSNDGFYGIWAWSAIPNKNDSFRDYITSRFDKDLDAIEVVVISEAANLDSLIGLLKGGAECQLHSRRILFSYCASKGQYIGALCSVSELTHTNGKVSFAEDCTKLPIYAFSNAEILRLDNNLSFYKKAFAGQPIKLYLLKSPLDIVRDIVLSSVSWAAYKSREVTRSQYRTFRDFLSAIPVEDVTPKIETECHCSSSTAKALFDDFMKKILAYVDGNSLEDEVLRAAISASAELQDRTKALILTEWKSENERLLLNAQQELDAVAVQKESAVASLNAEKEVLNKLKLEEERLSGDIAEKEKLAKEVEEAVAERIKKAHENVADFIADMAFFDERQSQAMERPVEIEASSMAITSSYQLVSEFEDISDLEAHHSWNDVINTAAFELGEAGVSEKYSIGLAAFLCAAYIEKQAILLVGPNAIDIVEAFCASVTGHKHGVLCCEDSYNNRLIGEVGTDGENIVMINNLITSAWIHRLPEILSHKNVFYVATHPYAEDIQAEPKSLYGFMLPLFTEFFVDDTAAGNYYGGYFADDFEPYSASNTARRDLKALSHFAPSSLVRNRINKILTAMHSIHSDTTVDEEFLFVLLPLAYASLEVGKLKEALADPQKGIAISADLKRDLKYVLGDA